MSKLNGLLEAQVSNDSDDMISDTIPYRARITIEGDAALLFHRWSSDAVATKAAAAKGSKAKKSDDTESYVWRCENGNLGIPGEYLRQSIIHAAKFEQDPRSPRKSMMDLAKATVISLTDLHDLGVEQWDFEDRRRVVIQRNAVTRIRPAMRAGWRAEFVFMCNMPQYITPPILHRLAVSAGMVVGIGDFRPTFGRFRVTGFEVLTLSQ